MTLPTKFTTRRELISTTEKELREKRDAIIARAKHEVRDASDAFEATLAALRAEAATVAEDIEINLAEDARTNLAHLVKAFCTDPTRARVVELAAYWRALNARAVDGLGAEVDWRHLVVAFASAHGGAGGLGHRDAFLCTGEAKHCVHATKAHRAMADGAALPIVEHALRELERTAIPAAERFPADVDRLGVLVSRATESGISRALATFDNSGAPKPRPIEGPKTRIVAPHDVYPYTAPPPAEDEPSSVIAQALRLFGGAA
jgi:hypothetical protein